MDKKVEFRPVYATFDQGKVAFIKSLFAANAINYYVDNEYGATTGDYKKLTFMVISSQEEKANELLQEVK